MSKITLSIYNQESLEKCCDLIDAAVLMVPYNSYVYEEDFDIDKAIEFCNEHDITPILSISKIYLESELAEIKKIIEKYKDNLFLVSDLGLFELFRTLNLEQNCIYESSTLICNSMDLQLMSNYKFNAITMSNEIPIYDVIQCYEKTNSSIFYQVFGRKMMFYSKRKLLSLYKKYRGLNFSNDNLSLIEEQRSYLIPIIENKTGFYCYRNYLISLLKEIKKLSFAKYLYFESITLSSNEIKEILLIYKLFIDDKISFEEASQKLEKITTNIEDGFSYSDTVYIKEKIIQ